MAIEKVQMFTVVCDNCKADIGSYSEYSAWLDENQAQVVAMESDWIRHENGHLCNDCYEYDDDDEIIIKTERKDKYLNEL